MCKYYCMLFCLAVIAGSGSARLLDGWYRIQCNTRNKGLQAWAKNQGSSVSILPPDDDVKFRFYVESRSNEQYVIKHASSGEKLVATAHPEDKVIKLETYANHQNQRWSLEFAGSAGLYRITCATLNMGPKYVSAHPKSSSVSLDDIDINDPDQKWFFVKV